MLLEPLVLVGLFGLLLNDHVLKAEAAGTPWTLLTGKLSDVCGLFFFPFLVYAGLELVGLRRRIPATDGRLAGTIVVVVATVFAATNLSDLAGDAWAWSLGALQWPAHAAMAALGDMPSPPIRRVAHVVDPTDLLALPATLGLWWKLRRRR